MKFILLAVAAATVCAQTFPVAGIVVDSESGSAVRRVRVVLETRPPLTMVTGDDGKFEFQAPKGKFGFYGEKLGWRQVFGGGFGSAVIAGLDQDTAHLVFRWYAPGAIYGKVLDDRGDPVASANVQLIRNPIVNGRRRSITAGSARTDDRGYYRFGPIAAGIYYVVAAGEPWYVQPLRFSRGIFPNPANPGPSEPTPGYAPSYYSNASDPSGASPVVVKPGADTEADFTLRTITGANLHFSCPNVERCSGSVSLYGEGINGVETLVQQSYAAVMQGMGGIPPGRYVVHFSGTGGSMRKPIDVGAGDLSVELAPQAAPSVLGKVAFKNPDAKPKRPIYVRMVNQETGAAIARAVEPDGSFTWSRLAVANYRPEIGSVEGFFAEQVSVEGAPAHDGVIDVAEGASIRLNIVVSDEAGRLKGFVMNAEKPVPAALVLLASVKDTPDSAPYLGFQTDSDGSFDFTSVRAGDYHLFALESTEGVEYANPAVIRPYFTGSLVVHIEAHKTQEQNLSVSVPARSPVP
jgi:uncharacterized GH25 family protein